MMKKLFFSIILFLCIFPFYIVDAREYSFPEDDFKIELSEDFYVITEENYTTNESFDKFVEYLNPGENYPKDSYEKYVKSYIDNYGMLFVAINIEKGYSITFEIQPTNISEDDLSYEQMLSVQEFLMDEFSNELGIEIDETHVTKINNIPVLELKYNVYTTQSNHYYLVHNGNAYNFIFESSRQLDSNDCLDVLSGMTISNYNYGDRKENVNYSFVIVIGCVTLVIIALVIMLLKKKKTKY